MFGMGSSVKFGFAASLKGIVLKAPIKKHFIAADPRITGFLNSEHCEVN
jgi:hypothetical protein